MGVVVCETKRDVDEVTIIHPSSRSYYGQYRDLSFSVYDGATGLHIWFHRPGEWDDDEVAAVLHTSDQKGVGIDPLLRIMATSVAP